MKIAKMISKPLLRIGSVSSTTGDNPHAMARMVQHGNVDVIVGDWLSEMNIAWNSIVKQQNPDLGYEVGFLEQLADSLDDIVKKGLKVITNAGALNTRSLAREVRKLCKSRGYDVPVAAVLGDDIPTDMYAASFSGERGLHGPTAYFWSNGVLRFCTFLVSGPEFQF